MVRPLIQGADDMDQRSEFAPLSQISTLWTVVCQAHGGPTEMATAAQRELMKRYGKAVQRYLVGALRDQHAAEELTQEFALRFVRGDFRGVDRQRGRFRDFVKGVLFHLIADHYRRRRARPNEVPADLVDPVNLAEPPPEYDRQFLDSWREELLNRAWNALAEVEKDTGQPFHTVLRFRVEHPDLRSTQMAEQLGALLQRTLRADWVRQILHRARDKFADLLIADVAETLESSSADDLAQELIDVGLMDYCRPALQRFTKKA
jgi:RNA polymerase sigma-70 factor (ECF subfamily)